MPWGHPGKILPGLFRFFDFARVRDSQTLTFESLDQNRFRIVKGLQCNRYIDVGDGCWWRIMLVTIIRCWFWLFWSPTSTNIHYLNINVELQHSKMSPTSKFSHQHPQFLSNFKSLTSRCHQHHWHLSKIGGMDHTSLSEPEFRGCPLDRTDQEMRRHKLDIDRLLNLVCG